MTTVPQASSRSARPRRRPRPSRCGAGRGRGRGCAAGRSGRAAFIMCSPGPWRISADLGERPTRLTPRGARTCRRGPAARTHGFAPPAGGAPCGVGSGGEGAERGLSAPGTVLGVCVSTDEATLRATGGSRGPCIEDLSPPPARLPSARACYPQAARRRVPATPTGRAGALIAHAPGRSAFLHAARPPAPITALQPLRARIRTALPMPQGRRQYAPAPKDGGPRMRNSRAQHVRSLAAQRSASAE